MRRHAALALVLAALTTGCSSDPVATPLPTAMPSTTQPAPLVTQPAPLVTPSVFSGTSTSQAVATTAPRWRPTVGLSWQWQLSGRLNFAPNVKVYDVDLFTTTAEQVRRLHALGRKAICYLSAGSWEPYRPDSARFPGAVRGRTLEGFEDERWLDIRRTDVLLPLMAKRMDLCKAKGFDAVEPDNVDGYANRTGFPLTATHQLRYNRALAGLAHARGLAVGLKNDLDQVPALVTSFDFAVNEQCVEYDECGALRPFVTAGKPVFHVEYALAPRDFCPVTKPLRFSSLLKNEDLDATRTACP